MLEELKSLPRPIRVGLTGMGAMGRGLFYQMSITPGFECAAVADERVERAADCARWLGKPFRVVETLDAANDAVRAGLVAVSADGSIPARVESVDAFIESTSAVLPGLRYSEAAIESGKHLVLMNSEVDLVFGPALLERARRKGVVYTSCDGDQHCVLKRLADDVRLWGFEPVMAGNIKGFLDRTANPESIVPEADKRRLDHRMAAAYTDGTKLAVEMALVANGLGYAVRETGMRGPRAEHVKDVFRLFDFEALWRDRQPFVEYILGAEPGGGVFMVGFSENEYQRFMMSYYKMGDGPFYLFYRPYHLCHVEALACVADAVLRGRSLLEPAAGFRAGVTAYAKRGLRKGRRLDGPGGFDCYGMIEAWSDADPDPGLPVLLSEDVELVRDVPRHGRIALADVRIGPGREDFSAFEAAIGASRRIRP
jgi:predicted homoserine dehydrogenase-like protein